MDENKRKKIGDAWKALDEKYDTTILELIEAPQATLSREKLEELKKMQDELFDLETKLFEVLQSEI